MRECSSTLPAIKREVFAPRLDFVVSKKGTDTPLNGLLVAKGPPETLQVKNYRKVDKVFLFLAGFIDRCTGCMKEAPLTEIHVLYYRLMLHMTTA